MKKLPLIARIVLGLIFLHLDSWGALLLSGLFVPLSLVVLAPMVVNILLTHLLLAPSGLPLALVLVVIQGYLAFYADPYRRVIRGLFKARQ